MTATADTISAARKRITGLQKQMTSKILLMAAEVGKLLEVMSEEEAREFLRVGCNLANSEVSTYIGVTTKLGGSESILQQSRASYTVIKSLVCADDELRSEVLARMDVGARIDLKEISDVRKSLRAAKLTAAQITAARNTKIAISAARKQAAARAAAFQTDLESLVHDLTNQPPRFLPDVATSASVRRKASRLRKEYLRLFGQDTAARVVPRASSQRRLLPLTYEALCRASEGRFGSPEHYEAEAPIQSDGSLIFALRGLTSYPARKGIVGWDNDGRVLAELPPHRERLKALEICAGAGGMAIGLEAAGFRHTALFEAEKHAAATLRLNRPDWRVIEADIRTVDFKRYRNQQISLVAGGIPCQPYSQDGRGLGKDDPRDLLLEAVRIVKEVRPRAFVFENVVGLLHARHADHLANVLRRFRMAGYQTEIQRLECEDFGIAQQRSRLLIVGVRKELAGSFRMPPAFPQRRLNLGDALVDLMAANGWRGAEEWARQRREHPICDREGNVTGFGVLAPTIVKSVGERRPNDHQAWLSRGIDIAKLPDEAPTDEQGSVPGFLPGLTPRMRARLQGFPDSWNFSGGKTAMTNQVGNAAPPRLAQAVGLALVAAMKNVTWDWQALLWPQESERVLVDPPALDVNLDLQEIAPLAQLNDSKVVARA